MKLVISQQNRAEAVAVFNNASSSHDAMVALCGAIALENGMSTGDPQDCTKAEKEMRHDLYKRLCEIAEKAQPKPVSASTVSRAMAEAGLRYKVARKPQDWQPGVKSARLFVKLLELAGDCLDKKTGEDVGKLLVLHDANRLHVTKTAIEIRDTKGNTTGRILLQAGKFEVVSKAGKDTGKPTQADKQQADKVTGEQIASVTPGNVSEDVKRVRAAVA